MKRSVVRLFASMFLLLILTPTVYAQATRTWVSGVGDDVNPCSRTAPCKTFAGAISKTATGGEIDALDPGGFGTVTITKPITIDGGGTLASILASGTNGINVNVSTPGVVVLRNLSINGAGTTLGLNGVSFLAGTQLVVEHCSIFGFSQAAINVSLSQSGAVTVRDTSITNVASGLSLAASSGSAFGTISNSTVSFASSAALVVNNGVLNAAGNTLSNNQGTAVLPTAGVIRLSNNDIFNNGVGTGTGAGTIVSAGNNHKAGNGADPAPQTASISTF